MSDITQTSPVYVLVHGAWHGAWCWSRTIPALTAMGVSAHAINLTGVGERAHLLSAQINLSTHAADVIETIRSHEWSSVVLVGHSYGGMVITQAAQRLMKELPGVLQRLVYIDAHVPMDGESWGLVQSEGTRQLRLAEGDDRDWVNRRQTPQPFGVYVDPVRVDNAALDRCHRTYINCTGNVLSGLEISRSRVKGNPLWRYVEMATGHDPMVSHPEALADCLVRSAEIAPQG